MLAKCNAYLQICENIETKIHCSCINTDIKEQSLLHVMFCSGMAFASLAGFCLAPELDCLDLVSTAGLLNLVLILIGLIDLRVGIDIGLAAAGPTTRTLPMNGLEL